MAYMIKLACPSCGDTFRWPAKDDWPKHCPLCGYSTAMPERTEIQAPLIANPKNKSHDQVYRQYEQATADNAQAAADMLGVSASDMADLKVTNMEDGIRQGDLSVKPPVNPVSTFMQQHPQAVSQAAAQAQGYASMAHQGPDAYAGARALGMLRERHQKYGAAAIMGGQKTEPGMAPSAPPMLYEHPTKEVHDRALRQGGKVTF